MERKEVFLQLKEKFSRDEVKWRVLRGGTKNGRTWAKVIPFVDARVIQERLDEAAGPENWQDEYTATDRGLLCVLSVRVGEEWIRKSGTAEYSGQNNPVRSAESFALKRAASKFGIGRYFYSLPDFYAVIRDDGKGAFRGQCKDAGRMVSFTWDLPRGHEEAYAGGGAREQRTKAPVRELSSSDSRANAAPSKPGKPPLTGDDRVKQSIFELLQDPVFTEDDIRVAASVIPKIQAPGGLEAYWKQWEREREKRSRAPREAAFQGVS